MCRTTVEVAWQPVRHIRRRDKGQNEWNWRELYLVSLGDTNALKLYWFELPTLRWNSAVSFKAQRSIIQFSRTKSSQPPPQPHTSPSTEKISEPELWAGLTVWNSMEQETQIFSEYFGEFYIKELNTLVCLSVYHKPLCFSMYFCVEMKFQIKQLFLKVTVWNEVKLSTQDSCKDRELLTKILL